MLTARWGVWLGAAALVLAGVFLVRYAVDEGLLGPAIRCVLAALLGAALIVAAEWLRRREVLRPDITDQAAPGLAAGGVAILFGAAYGAGVLYELVPPSAGFVLLAAASLVGVAISLRHGQLVAAVGLVGAFVTPALVQTENPSLPGLFGYLLFVTATALAVVRYTAWIWLGWATTIAGAVWVLLAIAAGTDSDIWAPALFVPAAAALNLGLLPRAALDHPIGRRLAWVPCAALGATGLLLAMLDQGWMARIGVLLFVPLTIWQGDAREPTAARCRSWRHCCSCCCWPAGRSRSATGPTSPSRPARGRPPWCRRCWPPPRWLPAASPPAGCGSSAVRCIRCRGRASPLRCPC